MAADERVHGLGHFVWERGSERLETGNRITAEISDGQVHCEVSGASGKTETIDVSGKDAVRMLRKLAYAMQQTGRQPRAFAGPVWKPKAKRPSAAPQASVECPACIGGHLSCALCGGEGWVSLAKIEHWRRGTE